MFCNQDAYAPKSLDYKGFQAQRIQTPTGSSRKPISKHEILKPYLDYDFSDVQADKIAQAFQRYIKETRKHKKETTLFVEDILNRILFLHKYNLKVAEVTGKYPLTRNFTQLLLHYIVLECNVLYRREFYSPRYETVVEKRILRVLNSIYNSYFETLTGVPPKKLFEESAKAILNLIIKVKPEFDIQNKLLENIVIKLLSKIGKLEKVAALKGKCIPCPLDTYLSDPEVVNTYKNIITSDYGTDDDLKIDEEEIEVCEQEQDDDSNNLDADIKLEVDNLKTPVRPHQQTICKTPAKVPTIFIDDDDDVHMISWEEEVRTSSKSCRRQEKEEEQKKNISREREKKLFSNHKPIKIHSDIKTEVKEEVVDFDFKDKLRISIISNSNLCNDKKSTSTSDEVSSRDVNVKNVEEHDVLVLSSDEDESYDSVPKEKENELLGDDDDVVIEPHVVESTKTEAQENLTHTTCQVALEADSTDISNLDFTSNFDVDETNPVTLGIEDAEIKDKRDDVTENAEETQQPIEIPSSNGNVLCRESHPTSTVFIENISESNSLKDDGFEDKSNDFVDFDSSEVQEAKLIEQNETRFESMALETKPETTQVNETVTEDVAIEARNCDEGISKEVFPLQDVVNEFPRNETNDVALETSVEEEEDTEELPAEISIESSHTSTSDKQNEFIVQEELLVYDKINNFTSTPPETNSEIKIEDGISEDETKMENNEVKPKNEDVEVAVSQVDDNGLTKDPVTEDVKINNENSPDTVSTDETLEESCDKSSEETAENCEKLHIHSVYVIQGIKIYEMKNEVIKQTTSDADEKERAKDEGCSSVTQISNERKQFIKESVAVDEAVGSVESSVPKEIEENQKNIVESVEDSMPSEYNFSEQPTNIIECNISSTTESSIPDMQEEIDTKLSSEDSESSAYQSCPDELPNSADKTDLVINEQSENFFVEENLVISEDIQAPNLEEEKYMEENKTETIKPAEETVDLSQFNRDEDLAATLHIESDSGEIEESVPKDVANIEKNGNNERNMCDKDVDITASPVVGIDTDEEIETETQENTSSIFKTDKGTDFCGKPSQEAAEECCKDQAPKVRINEDKGQIKGDQSEDTESIDTSAQYEYINSDGYEENLGEIDEESNEDPLANSDTSPSSDAEEKCIEHGSFSTEISEVNHAKLHSEDHDEEIFNTFKTAENFEEEKIVVISENLETPILEKDQYVEDTETETTRTHDENIEFQEECGEDIVDLSLVNAEEKINTDSEVDKEQQDIDGEYIIEEDKEESHEERQDLESFDTVEEVVNSVEETMSEPTIAKWNNIEVTEDKTEIKKVTTDDTVRYCEEQMELIEEESVTDIADESIPVTGTEELIESTKIDAEYISETTNIHVPVVCNEVEVYQDKLTINNDQAAQTVEDYPHEITPEAVETYNPVYGGGNNLIVPHFDAYEEIGHENASKIVPEGALTDIDASDSLLKKLNVLKQLGTEILAASNNQLIPEKVVQDLEIHEIHSKTSLDILATVATEVSRQDLLCNKKSTGKGRRKKVPLHIKSSAGEIKRNQRRKKILDSAEVENKRITRNSLVKSNEQQKCKPHDFIVNNSKSLPPTNNIYAHKLAEINVTSEDSNDSEGNLFIDEGIDAKIGKVKETEDKNDHNLTCYDEDTSEENIVCPYEPRVKGTVLISIPDNYQDNFDILKQIEEMEECNSGNYGDAYIEKGRSGEEYSHAEFDTTYPTVNEIEVNTEVSEFSSFVADMDFSEKASAKESCRPFRTMAERKDYDKFKLDPYVRIEKLDIRCEEPQKKEKRSKSFDIDLIRHKDGGLGDNKEADEQQVEISQHKKEKSVHKESASEALQSSKVLVEEKSTICVDPTIKDQRNEVKEGETDIGDETSQIDSDLDDTPLLQRTQNRQRSYDPRIAKRKKEKRVDMKGLKSIKGAKEREVKSKIRKRQKKLRRNKRESENKTGNTASGSITKSPKKFVTFQDIKEDIFTISNTKWYENDTKLNLVAPTAEPPKNSIKQKSRDENLNDENVKSKLVLKENVSQCTSTAIKKSPRRVEENTHEDDTVKSSNKKYYTTPKLRRKSVSKDSLNRIEKNAVNMTTRPEDILNKVVDEKLSLSSDKKYNMPPKLRRKSMIDNGTAHLKEAVIRKTVKQLKPTPEKVDMLSRCKNTVSPTTEKLKKKLETDFNLSCTDLLLENDQSAVNGLPGETEGGMLVDTPNIEYHKATSDLAQSGSRTNEEVICTNDETIRDNKPSRILPEKIETRLEEKAVTEEAANFEKEESEELPVVSEKITSQELENKNLHGETDDKTEDGVLINEKDSVSEKEYRQSELNIQLEVPSTMSKEKSEGDGKLETNLEVCTAVDGYNREEIVTSVENGIDLDNVPLLERSFKLKESPDSIIKLENEPESGGKRSLSFSDSKTKESRQQRRVNRSKSDTDIEDIKTSMPTQVFFAESANMDSNTAGVDVSTSNPAQNLEKFSINCDVKTVDVCSDTNEHLTDVNNEREKVNNDDLPKDGEITDKVEDNKKIKAVMNVVNGKNDIETVHLEKKSRKERKISELETEPLLKESKKECKAKDPELGETVDQKTKNSTAKKENAVKETNDTANKKEKPSSKEHRRAENDAKDKHIRSNSTYVTSASKQVSDKRERKDHISKSSHLEREERRRDYERYERSKTDRNRKHKSESRSSSVSSSSSRHTSDHDLHKDTSRNEKHRSKSKSTDTSLKLPSSKIDSKHQSHRYERSASSSKHESHHHRHKNSKCKNDHRSHSSRSHSKRYPMASPVADGTSKKMVHDNSVPTEKAHRSSTSSVADKSISEARKMVETSKSSSKERKSKERQKEKEKRESRHKQQSKTSILKSEAEKTENSLIKGVKEKLGNAKEVENILENPQITDNTEKKRNRSETLQIASNAGEKKNRLETPQITDNTEKKNRLETLHITDNAKEKKNMLETPQITDNTEKKRNRLETLQITDNAEEKKYRLETFEIRDNTEENKYRLETSEITDNAEEKKNSLETPQITDNTEKKKYRLETSEITDNAEEKKNRLETSQITDNTEKKNILETVQITDNAEEKKDTLETSQITEKKKYKLETSEITDNTEKKNRLETVQITDNAEEKKDTLETSQITENTKKKKYRLETSEITDNAEEKKNKLETPQITDNTKKKRNRLEIFQITDTAEEKKYRLETSEIRDNTEEKKYRLETSEITDNAEEKKNKLETPQITDNTKKKRNRLEIFQITDTAEEKKYRLETSEIRDNTEEKKYRLKTSEITDNAEEKKNRLETPQITDNTEKQRNRLETFQIPDVAKEKKYRLETSEIRDTTEEKKYRLKTSEITDSAEEKKNRFKTSDITDNAEEKKNRLETPQITGNTEKKNRLETLQITDNAEEKKYRLETSEIRDNTEEKKYRLETSEITDNPEEKKTRFKTSQIKGESVKELVNNNQINNDINLNENTISLQAEKTGINNDLQVKDVSKEKGKTDSISTEEEKDLVKKDITSEGGANLLKVEEICDKNIEKNALVQQNSLLGELNEKNTNVKQNSIAEIKEEISMCVEKDTDNQNTVEIIVENAVQKTEIVVNLVGEDDVKSSPDIKGSALDQIVESEKRDNIEDAVHSSVEVRNLANSGIKNKATDPSDEQGENISKTVMAEPIKQTNNEEATQILHDNLAPIEENMNEDSLKSLSTEGADLGKTVLHNKERDPSNSTSASTKSSKSKKTTETDITWVKLQNIQAAFEKYLPKKPKEEKHPETLDEPISLKVDKPAEELIDANSGTCKATTAKRKSNLLEDDTNEANNKSDTSFKKVKFEDISIIVPSCETPKQLSPSSNSPKKKEKKTIESIINHLMEEKASNTIPHEENVKSEINSSKIDAVDVTVLKKKLSQKIKRASEGILNVAVDKKLLENEEGQVLDLTVKVEDNTTEIKENTITVVIEKYEMNKNVDETEASNVNEDAEKNQLDSGRNEADENNSEQKPAVDMEVVTNNVNSENGDKALITVLSEKELRNTSPLDVSSETANPSTIDASFTSDSVISSTPDTSFTSQTEIPGTPDASFTIPSTPDASFTSDTEISSTPDASFTSDVPKPVVITSTSRIFIDDALQLKTEGDDIIPLDTERCSGHTFNVIESSFVDIPSVEKAGMQTLNPCAEDFSSASTEDSSILNLSELMMHVDSDPGSVTNMGEITVSPEDVCMLSDIISSAESKLPCVSSASKLFTFPVTCQADMKNQFIPLNSVATGKNILDGSNASTEKLVAHNGKGCVFSFREQMNTSGSQTLSLNLQDVPFSKIPIDSTQTLDLISPKSLSVVQTASSSSFMNEVPVANEISDIITEITCSAEPDDHNYTMGSFGGPLLSGRPEEKNILSTTFNKPLDDSPDEFPLNDNPLQELSEFSDNNLREIMPDDTYKLNLDNEYAVKTVVMLAGQTSSDANVFPLSNYNLADIERINLIECSITNSEENSNSKEYLETPNMEQEAKNTSNDLNPWTQFVMNENPNQKVVVLSNEQCLTPSFSISQNDLIQSFEDQIVETTIPTDILPLDTSDGILKETSPSHEECVTQKVCETERPKELKDVNGCKNNTQKAKKIMPEKATQKEIVETDFLPKRRYSRTVLRAPPKKKAALAPAKDGAKKESPVPNELPTTSTKETTPVTSPEQGATDASADSSGAIHGTKSRVDLLLTEHRQATKSPSPGRLEKSPATLTNTHPSKSPSVRENEENTLQKYQKEVTVARTELKNLINSGNVCEKKSDVQSNIADLVKSRKRAATNKYSNNSMPSIPTTKETPVKISETSKPKPTSAVDSAVESRKHVLIHPEKKPQTYSRSHKNPDLISQPYVKTESDDKRKSPHQISSDTQKNSPGESVNVIGSSKEPTKSAETSNKKPNQPTIPAEMSKKPCSKYNYTIDSILSQDAKSRASYENQVKDNKLAKGRGAKRSSSATEEEDRDLGRLDKRQTRQHGHSPQTEEQKDAFDKLLEQGNVNKLICLRVTEDNKLKTERRSSPLTRYVRDKERSDPNLPQPRGSDRDRARASRREEERRPDGRSNPHGSRQLPYPPMKHRQREGDYSRGREGYYSDHSRGREGQQLSYRRPGHQSDYTRGRGHHVDYTPSSSHPSAASHVNFSRSSNVSEAYYRSSGSSHPSGSVTNPAARQISGPYTKRNTILSPEKQNELLNSLKGKVLDQLSSIDRRKNNDEGEFSWIEKFNQRIDTNLLAPTNASTPQFIPQISSPRPHRK